MTKSEISKIIESLKQYINEILGGYTTKEKEVAKFELDCMSNYADKMPLLQGTFRMFLRRFYYDAESLFRLEEMDDPNLYNLGTIVQYIGKTTYDPNLSIEQNPFPCYANGLFYQVTCKGIINTKKFDSIGVEFDSELIGRFLMFNNGLDTEINAYNYTIIPMGEINGKYHWGLGRINGYDSTEIIYVFSSKEEMEFAGIKGFYGITESEYLSMFDESNPDDYPVFMYHTTSDRYWKLIDVQISSKGSASSIQLSELPLDASYLGKICQYVGETTEQYTYGYFYKCVPSENTAELNHNSTYYNYVQIDADLFAAAVGFVSGEYFVRADNDAGAGPWKITNDSSATVASASSKEELEALGVLNCFGKTPYPGGFSVQLVSGEPGTWEQVDVQPSVGKKYSNGEIFNDYQNNKSNGLNSHVEGSYNETTVEGSSSHVEGSHNVSKKQSSHVEGGYNVVSGLYAHVEGQKNNASGTSSHVEGVGLEGLVPEDRTYYIGGMGFEGTAKITGDNNQIQCGHSLPESYVGRIVKIYTGSLEFTVTLTEIVASYFASGLLKWEERLDDSLVSEWNASVTACNIVPMVEGGTVDRAPSEAAHAEGLGTVTTNVAEHAEGRFNISHADTIHSIGIGNSDSDRKNAVEVKVNGNAYYYGIGGYNGTNPDTSKSIQEVIEAGGTKVTQVGDIVLNNKTIVSYQEYKNNSMTGAKGVVIDPVKRLYVSLYPVTGQLCANAGADVFYTSKVAGDVSMFDGRDVPIKAYIYDRSYFPSYFPALYNANGPTPTGSYLASNGEILFMKENGIFDILRELNPSYPEVDNLVSCTPASTTTNNVFYGGYWGNLDYRSATENNSYARIGLI